MSRIADILEAAIAPAPPGLLSEAATPEQVRASMLKAFAALAPAHPSFRWQVNGALLAHRRADDGVTACGRTGELEVVVDVGVPPCPKCYPTT